MKRADQTQGRSGWTRRRALAALAATASAPTWPALAYAPPLPPALADICVAAAAAAPQARLGAAAAEGWTLSELTGSLRARLGPGAGADWRGALVASGRRDVAAHDLVEVLGQPMMRTEAEVLAIGALLNGFA